MTFANIMLAAIAFALGAIYDELRAIRRAQSEDARKKGE